VAKFRAARRLWARIMREEFGAVNPRSQMRLRRKPLLPHLCELPRPRPAMRGGPVASFEPRVAEPLRNRLRGPVAA